MQEPQLPAQNDGASPAHPWPFTQAILFTGHMIDVPHRKSPRFPPAAESAARSAIRASVASLLADHPHATIGVAGGACGGDILFHETCAELNVPTRMLLALPPDEFLQRSVAQAGPAWIDRFHALLARLSPGNVHVLSDKDGLLESPAANIWQRTNLWMIEEVVRLAPEPTLLALWDGKGGDGPGGTEHLVHVASAHGIRIAPILSMQSCLV